MRCTQGTFLKAISALSQCPFLRSLPKGTATYDIRYIFWLFMTYLIQSNINIPLMSYILRLFQIPQVTIHNALFDCLLNYSNFLKHFRGRTFLIHISRISSHFVLELIRLVKKLISILKQKIPKNNLQCFHKCFDQPFWFSKNINLLLKKQKQKIHL